MRLLILCFLLTGCAAGFVSKQVPTTAPPMMSCHAIYVSWFKDQTSFGASACDAVVGVGKTETKAGSLEAILLKKLTK